MSVILRTLYEEPTLGWRFGADYDDYRQRMHRWWPGPRRAAPQPALRSPPRTSSRSPVRECARVRSASAASGEAAASYFC